MKRVARRLRERQVRKSLDELPLANIDDHEIEQVIVDFVDARLARRGADEDQVGVFSALPPGMRALYLTWIVEIRSDRRRIRSLLLELGGAVRTGSGRGFRFLLGT